MRRNLLIAATSIGLGLLSFALYSQGVPTTINYQGRLTDNTPSQAPISGTVSMQFEIWDVASGGSASPNRLWREPNMDGSGVSVTATGGIFSYALGATVPIAPSVFSGGGNRYLQIIINPGAGQELLSPRQLIGATGYANHSENANTASWATAAAAANALALNGANCLPGSFPLGIDAGGAAEGCSAAGTGTVTNVSAAAPLSVVNGATSPDITLTGVVPVANGGTGSATQNFVDLSADQTVGGVKTFTSTMGGSISGNAATATALNSNGANCVAGQYPKGVDAGGVAESCTAVSLTTDVSGVLPIAGGGTGSSSLNFVTLNSAQTVTGAKTLHPSTNSPSLVLRQSAAATAGMDVFAIINNGGAGTFFRVDGTGQVIWAGTAAGNAATASALYANGANCAPGSYPLGMDAAGNAESCATAISGNAATATALAANGTNCAAGSLASGIDASGNAEGCANTISGNAGSASAVAWTGVTGKPAGFADNTDDDTLYTAGPGLRLTGTEFSLTLNDTTPAANIASTINSVNSVGQHTSVTIGDDGLPLISYYDATNGNLMVSHCADAGCTSATSATVDSAAADVGRYSAITIGRDGLGLISYYDQTNTNLKVAHCTDLACTAATITTIDASASDVGQYSSITIASDGYGIISYYDATGGNLKVADCSNVACTAAGIVTAVSTNDVGRYSSIAVNLIGQTVIGYQDVTNQNPVIAICGSSNCSGPITWGVDTTLNGGFFVSIAVGEDNEIILSHLAQAGEYELHIVHCNGGPVCNAPTVTNADPTTGAGGGPTSITIGTDGHPVVAYHDWNTFDLKFLYCMDTSCVTVRTATLDFTGSVGYYAALTVGRDGLPFISYYDTTNTALKVAHCGSKYCQPYFRRR